MKIEKVFPIPLDDMGEILNVWTEPYIKKHIVIGIPGIHL